MEEDRHEAVQKTFAAARTGSVYLFLAFLTFLNASNLAVLELGNITPYFLLMGIYFWLLSRPSLLPAWLVLVMGLSLDLISGQPVGLNGFCFLLIYFALHGQRRFLKGQSWPVLWAGYGLACLFVGLIHLVVFLLSNRFAWPGFVPLAATVLVSILTYPLVVMPMVAINRLFVK
jgi:rod shape-determining protein MreD